MSALRRWWHVHVLKHAVFPILSADPGLLFYVVPGRHSCSCGAHWGS